jgi:hypothetical protein
VVTPRRNRLRNILEHATLRPGLDLETAINMAVGSYYAEYLARGRPRRNWAERVADTLLAPPE